MELKITKNKLQVVIVDGRNEIKCISTDRLNRTIQTISHGVFGQTKEETEANSQLIVDAFNTTNSCGLLPSELLKQRDEMLEMLLTIQDSLFANKTPKEANPHHWTNKLENIIKQSTEKKL